METKIIQNTLAETMYEKSDIISATINRTMVEDHKKQIANGVITLAKNHMEYRIHLKGDRSVDGYVHKTEIKEKGKFQETTPFNLRMALGE